MFPFSVKVSLELAAVAAAILIFASPILCVIVNVAIEPDVITADVCKSLFFKFVAALWSVSTVQPADTLAKNDAE